MTKSKSKKLKASKLLMSKHNIPMNKHSQNSSIKSKSKSKLKPKRDSGKYGTIHFADYPMFLPNLTPKEILKMGSFGGTYFRPITSSITKKKYSNVHKEFPANWFTGLNIDVYVSSEKCNPSLNKYKVAAGTSLNAWESSGWIKEVDPYGWFQWYCRFYQGRRCEDDARQVDRWNKYAGEKSGRWRRNLINRCKKNNKSYDDESVSPVIRQGLQQWAYIVTKNHFDKHQ